MYIKNITQKLGISLNTIIKKKISDIAKLDSRINNPHNC